MSWPIVKIDEIVTFLDHMRKPVKKSDRREGEYPYYGANGQQGTIDGYIFDEPLVLLAEDGGHFDTPERGVAYRVEGKCWVNNHAHVLRANDRTTSEYLATVLRNLPLKKYITGTTRAKLTKAAAKRIEIPLPPLPEQRRIAGILDAADALRRRRREALALLDTLPGAIFAEMFGDPRDNPLGYPARKLSDLCSRITVGVVIKPASYYVDEGVPALRSVNVREGGFDLKDLKYFSQETNDGPLNKSKMKKGDVIIVRTGQPGRAAVVDEEVAGANCIDMLIASPKEDELLPYFLEAFLNSDAGRQMALSNQTGQVQQHLNATALKGIDFITPPIEEQREFARRLDEVRRVKEHLITHLTELDTLFASLQSRAFAGEL